MGAKLFEIETGHEVWSANTGAIGCVLITTKENIYASGYEKRQFLKIDLESGIVTELFPIVGWQHCLVQYRLFIQ